jgi:WD40 repeat protein
MSAGKQFILLFAVMTGVCLSGYAQPHATILGDKHGVVYDLTTAVDRGLLAASLGNRIEVWDYKNEKLLKSWEVVKISAIDLRGESLAGVSTDGNVSVWNIASGNVITGLKISNSPLTCIHWVDSASVVAGNDAGEIIKFNIRSNAIEFKVNTDKPVTAIAIQPITKIIITGDNAGMISLWNSGSGALIAHDQTHKDWVRSIKPVPNTQNIVSAADDGYAFVWRIDKGTKITFVSKTEVGSWALSVDVSQDPESDRLILATGLQNGKLKINFKRGTYVYKARVMINSIAIIQDELPKIRVIAGTHGKGIQVISASLMKLKEY